MSVIFVFGYHQAMATLRIDSLPNLAERRLRSLATRNGLSIEDQAVQLIHDGLKSKAAETGGRRPLKPGRSLADAVDEFRQACPWRLEDGDVDELRGRFHTPDLTAVDANDAGERADAGTEAA